MLPATETYTFPIYFCVHLLLNCLANIYLLKIKYRNTRKRCEICSKLTDAVLVFLLLTLTQLTFTCSKSTIERLEKRCKIFSKLRIKTSEFEHILYFFISSVSNVDFEQVNVSWGTCFTLFSSASMVEFSK